MLNYALVFGAPDDWVLKQRSRTSWDYDPEVRDAIKSLQGQSHRDGSAQPLMSIYLCLTQESTYEHLVLQSKH